VVVSGCGAASVRVKDASSVVSELVISSGEGDHHGAFVELGDDVTDSGVDPAVGLNTTNDVGFSCSDAVSVSGCVRGVAVVLTGTISLEEVDVLVDPAATASVVAVGDSTVDHVLLGESDGVNHDATVRSGRLEGEHSLHSGGDAEGDTRATCALVLDGGQVASISPVDFASGLEGTAVDRLAGVVEQAALAFISVSVAEHVSELLVVHISGEVQAPGSVLAWSLGFGVELLDCLLGLLVLVLVLGEVLGVLVVLVHLGSPLEELAVDAACRHDIDISVLLVILGVDEDGTKEGDGEKFVVHGMGFNWGNKINYKFKSRPFKS